jgi:hypothetical protein
MRDDGYTLNGTIGQPLTGDDSNGPYEIGFWKGVREGHSVYLPLVIRG